MKFSEFIIICILPFFILSCSITSEGKYRDLLEDYVEGEVNNTSVITEAILESFSLLSVNSDNFYFNKSTVITGSGGDISLVYPLEVKLNADKIISDNILYADAGQNRIVLGNSKGFCVFDIEGDPVNVYMADKKERIDASAIRGDNAVFLSGGRIQELSEEEKKVKKIDPGLYNPPYKKLFRSAMISNDKYYGLITGIAGSYYINIFDAASGSSLVKNIASSSFEFSIKDNDVLYVRGGTGVWSVVRFEIPIKKRNEVKKLGKISDVFIGESGFIYINEKRTYIETFEGEKWEAPAEFDVRGICRDSALVQYKGKTYIIEFNVLYERLKEFSQTKLLKKG